MDESMGGLEVRAWPTDVGLQERADGGQNITGLAVPYERKSQDLGGFREVIHAGAATDSVASGEIAMLWQHDPAHPISITSARNNALQVEDTPKGVRFRQPAEALLDEQLRRIADGVVRRMSFGFYATEEEWEELGGKRGHLRHITGMRLIELSPVTFAAYNSTSVALRHASQRGVSLPAPPQDSRPASVQQFLRHQEARLRGATEGL